MGSSALTFFLGLYLFHCAETLPVPLNRINFPPPSPPTAHPVIFVHGLLGNGKNFVSIAESLSMSLLKKRRLLSVDLRNHGSSPHESSMTYEEMAGDIFSVMESERIDRAVIIGHSMGGKVACIMSLLKPERVEGLVVLDMAPVSYSVDNGVGQVLRSTIDACAAMPTEIMGSVREITEYLIDKNVDDSSVRSFIMTNIDRKGKRWRCNIHTIQESLERLCGWETIAKTYEGDGE